MKIILAFILTMGMTVSGCAWSGGSSETPKTAQAAEQIEQGTAPEPAPTVTPEAKNAKKDAKAKKAEKASQKHKGKKTEAQIAAELDAVGHKLAAQASRTIMPSKASKEVRKVGNEFVASYVDVDANNVRTELRPGTKGQYVGFVRYQEKVMECRGASKQAALASTNCRQVKSRNLNELIHYDGTHWQY